MKDMRPKSITSIKSFFPVNLSISRVFIITWQKHIHTNHACYLQLKYWYYCKHVELYPSKTRLKNRRILKKTYFFIKKYQQAKYVSLTYKTTICTMCHKMKMNILKVQTENKMIITTYW